MHKGLVIAFTLTSSAGVQSSAAAPKCVPVNCHVYNGTHGPV